LAARDDAVMDSITLVVTAVALGASARPEGRHGAGGQGCSSTGRGGTLLLVAELVALVAEV
jgi:hypothetical protein